MENFRALVVGAGVGGPVLAYWLGKAGAQVTMIERGSSLPASGQGLDFDGPSKEIVRRMGVLEDMKAKRTNETGFAFVDDKGKNVAVIDGMGEGGVTSEIEVMRGDMVKILCKAANQFDNVNILYNRTVQNIIHDPDKVTVTFSDGESAEYDAVIGADGLHSKTRQLAFGKEKSAAAVRFRPTWVGFCSMPLEEGDGARALVQHAPGGRIVFWRPLDGKRASVYLMVFRKDKELEHGMRQGLQAQKEVLRKEFSDVGGLAPRCVREMMSAHDLWAGQLAQVHLDKWSRGRCALIGDAAYACSPLAGAGTHLAILGAYHLAGELSKNPQNPVAAMEAWENRVRPHIDQEQKILFGGYAQNLLQPQTRLGISLLRSGSKAVAWAFPKIYRSGPESEEQQVKFPSGFFPSYPEMDPEGGKPTPWTSPYNFPN